MNVWEFLDKNIVFVVIIIGVIATAVVSAITAAG